jgi:uncharacterized membrane-anchored protein
MNRARLSDVLTQEVAVKVPAVTAAFWIIKLLTTAMGEAASDWSVHTINPVIAVLVGAALFSFALVFTLVAKSYQPVRYWLSVAMVGVFGTMVADVLHVGFHIPYAVTTLACAVVLGVVFFTWQRREGTLSIHSITSRRRELFYWAAVVATFAFGTAIGDLSAVQFQLGYAGSIVLYGALLALPALWFAVKRTNAIATFWTAYILTRPLGASIADWVGVSPQRGGLDLGPGNVALVLTLLIAVFVAVLEVQQRSSNRKLLP